MILLLVIPLITAILTGFLVKYTKIIWILFFISSGYVAYSLFSLYGNWDIVYSIDTGLKMFNADIVLTVANNPLGWFFAFFSALTTLVISVFSLGYNDEKHTSKVAPLWMLLIFSNLGIFFSQDWITFFAMWELMGWTSFFAVGGGSSRAFRGAKYYLVLSLIGASSMLMGIVLLGNQAGTFDIYKAAYALVMLFQSNLPLAVTIFILFLAAFLIKSAAFPFYMWPEKVYSEGPSDFVTFMSAVMIKYGVYGIMLFLIPVAGSSGLPLILGRTNWIAYLIGYIGAISAVLGTILAIFQTDMKKLFAYSSVANIGYILMGFSSMTIIGVEGGIFHVVNHMVLKAAIFLTLAAVYFRTGESDMHKLGGLVYKMPLTFMTFLLGIIAAAGIPPLNGFPSKWMIIQSLMTRKMIFIAIAMIFSSTGAFMYLFRALASIFLGQLPDKFKNVKEVPPVMAIPMAVMMVGMLLLGVVPGVVLKPLTSVLSAIGYNVPQASWTTIEGAMKNSTINLVQVFYIFIAGFIISAIMYLVSAKQRKVPQEDNYTAGEYPMEWGTTPDRFNYSYSFYQPFKEMFDPLLERISFDRWFVNIGGNFERASSTIRALYTRGEGAVLMLCLGILLFIIGGWLL